MFERIARAVSKDGAKAAADAAGKEFIALTIPRTPVKTGALRRSIKLHPGGGGLISTSRAGTGLVYAEIQNTGGDIHVKHTFTTKGGKTLPGFLSDGSSFFGRSVHIKGSGYWTLAGKGAACGEAASSAIEAIIDAAA